MNEREIFAQALDISDPKDRAEYLERVCVDRPKLRSDVEQLLLAHEQLGSFLNRGVATAEESPPTATFADPKERAGTIVAGRYKLLEAIGEGGMGVVWLTEQRAPVKRLVAIKLIKPGMDSKAVLARFEAERLALALMDHPNIARIHDGGMTETGSPYFVMELVKGTPITEFCDARRLTPRQRLELFVPVCQAIQHAHQKGIIHRDIKPSNVLVTLYDDVPVPKVIDFGLAKATGQALTDQTLNTAFKIVGTPQYMSPEQATVNQLDIDTRSDIYSLGVVLYELLAGSPPFKKKELEKAGLMEILRVIREDEPPRPSTKVSTAEGLPTISAKRGIEPSKLTGMLRNELDWIVMKALEKDRKRRYETANGFAADINRYLAGEAVLAHPPTRTYRFKKFLRKNRGPVLATSMIFAALLAGVIGTTLGLIQARAQRKIADEERKKAQVAERETAKRADELAMVSDFQAGMLEQIKPTLAGVLLSDDVRDKFRLLLTKSDIPETDRKLQLQAFTSQWNKLNVTDAAVALIDRTILQPAVKTIDAKFGNQPAVDARLRQVLATRYRELGLFEEAIPLQERALETRRRVLGDKNELTLFSINEMASLLRDMGKYSEAELLAREAFEKCQLVLGDDHPSTIGASGNLAVLLFLQGNLEEAEPLAREAMEKYRHVLGDDHPQTLYLIQNLATILKKKGKLEKAEPYFREALEKRRRTLGEEHPDTLSSISELAMLLRYQGKSSEAEPLLREALEKTRRVLGEEHPITLASIGNLGSLLLDQGKLKEAEPLLREGVEKSRRVLGEKHPDTLTAIDSLGVLLQDQGKLAEAEPYVREALDKSRQILGEEHPATLRSLNNLGGLYWSCKQFDKSVPLFEELLKKHEAKLGREHPDTLSVVANLGVNYKDAGKLDDAIPLLEEACRAGQKYPGLLLCRPELAEAYSKAGRVSEAETLIKAILADSRKSLPAESPQLGGIFARCGMILIENKSYADAEAVLRECLTLRQKIEPDRWQTPGTSSMLGGALLGQKKFAEAEPLLLAGYEGMKQREATMPPEARNRIIESIDRLIELYSAMENPDEAAKWQAKLDEFKAAESARATSNANK